MAHAAGTLVSQINVGGPAIASFVADTDFTGGSTAVSEAAISTSVDVLAEIRVSSVPAFFYANTPCFGSGSLEDDLADQGAPQRSCFGWDSHSHVSQDHPPRITHYP